MPIVPISKATLVSPLDLTGGPQALHQLAGALQDIGVEADIAYYHRRPGAIRVFRDGILCEPPAANPCLEAYAEYRPRVCLKARLEPGRLIVLPEARAGWAPYFGASPVAVWWLGLNLEFPGSPLNRPAVRGRVLGEPRLIHLFATRHAEQALRPLVAGPAARLSDYTAQSFLDPPPEGPNPDAVVGFNPKRGAHLAERFARLHPQVPLRPIQGLRREQVAPAMRRLRAYVDFSDFRGRECMPREAAAAGAVVLVHRTGAAADPQDYPLPPAYKFEEAQIGSGELAARLLEVLAEPGPAWRQQQRFRNSVRAEKALFLRQVQQLFGPVATAD